MAAVVCIRIRNLDDVAASDSRDPLEVLAVHEALDQLAEKAPRKAELVKLRYFLGCTIAEAAQVLGISHATAEERLDLLQGMAAPAVAPGRARE